MWTPLLFDFLRELAANNNKEWFAANKARYEAEAKGPMLAFIEAFAPKLASLSPTFVASPRSLFRIYRDTRFGADKTPYKTNLGAHFPHEDGKDVHAPGFYLHLQPGEIFGGGGLWHPDSKALGQVREAMLAYPQRWRNSVQGMELSGGSLKRPPRGIDPEHPLIEDLKRKDFVFMRKFTEAESCRPDFLERFSAVCEETAPLIKFLCQGLNLSY